MNVLKRYINRTKRLVDTTIILQSLRAKTSSLKYNVLKMAVFITYNVDVVYCEKPGCGPLYYLTQMNILTYKSSKLVRGFEAW